MRQVKDLADTSVAVGLIEWETHEMEQVIADQTIPETTRQAVVMARRGQGLFKQNVKRIEAFCRVTKVDRIEHRRESHCKPWRDASNVESLDGGNVRLMELEVGQQF